jgi:AcrR family transcriptional regulator
VCGPVTVRASGPAPSLSREQIAGAAVTLADTSGIEAVSMRTLAGELGVGATSLYRYVDRRDELIELMVDDVTGHDLHFESVGDWCARLLSVVDGLGLEIDEVLVMLVMVDAYVRGRALEELSEQAAVRRSGRDQEQWMQPQVPYIESRMDGGRYPILTRVVFDAQAPHDPDRIEHGFDVGARAGTRWLGADASRVAYGGEAPLEVLDEPEDG